ncbi:50S ribosomal protein L7/L12 [bacterium]|nr:50S ribosomal protein L7/L12 [bacterium]
MAEEKKKEEEAKKEKEPKKEEAPKQEIKEKTPEEKEEKPKEVKVPEKFKKIVEEIEKMKVVDLAELVKILEEKFGVSAIPQVVSSSPAGGGAASTEAVAEEKTVFNIELQEVGAKKIEVIKVVRDITQKGLKESKDLVDAAEKEPQMIKENVKKEEAEEIKKKFEQAGAKVELK